MTWYKTAGFLHFPQEYPNEQNRFSLANDHYKGPGNLSAQYHPNYFGVAGNEVQHFTEQSIKYPDTTDETGKQLI